MNENINRNNNFNDVERMKWIDFSGLHTVVHHQCFQMVDTLTHHCRRTMCGLNPYALPYVPKHQDMNEKEGKKKNKNVQLHACKTRKKKPFNDECKTCKDAKRKNNTKKNNNKEEENKIDGNRFKRLQAMVGDLTDQVEDDACKGKTEQKKIEKKTNTHHVDQISVNALDTLT